MLKGRSEAGLALIEAVAAAAVLGIVALGVLAGVDGGSRASGGEKARAVAATLVEQDQERLRSFRAVDLSNYYLERIVPVAGVEYTVKSSTEWIQDATGGTQSCVNSANQADYLRVRSEVTSNVVGRRTQPVRVDSLVAPPVGSFSADQGTLAVEVSDRDGVGVPNMPVSIAGPANLTNVTNAFGCAVFAYIPVGSYTITIDQAGWVDPGGNQVLTSPGSTVTSGTVNVRSFEYDVAGSAQVTFETIADDGSTLPSKGWSVTASHSGIPATGRRSFAGAAVTAPGVGNVVADRLFPFDSAYGFYGGSCQSNDPENAPSAIEDYFLTNPGSQQIDRGTTHPVTVRQPALNMRIKGVLGLYLDGVRVMAKMDDPSDPSCTTQLTLTTTSRGAEAGWVSQLPLTGAYDPGVPYGLYTVCADTFGLPGPTTHKLFPTKIAATSPTGTSITPSVPEIDLSSGTTGGTCPA